MACEPINYTPDTYLYADELCGELVENVMKDGSVQIHAVLSYPLLHKSEEEKNQYFEALTASWNKNSVEEKFDVKNFIYRIPGVRKTLFAEYAKFANHSSTLLEAMRNFYEEETYLVKCRRGKIGSETIYVPAFKQHIRAAQNLDVFKNENNEGFISTPGSIVEANIPFLDFMISIDYESYYTFRKERPVYDDDDETEHPEIPLDDPNYYPEYKDEDMDRRDQLIIIRYFKAFIAEGYHLEVLEEMLHPDRLKKVKESDDYYEKKRISYASDSRPEKQAKANLSAEEVERRNFIRSLFHPLYEGCTAIGYHPVISAAAKFLATDFDSNKYKISEIRAMIGLKSDQTKEERTQIKQENEIIIEILKANKREKTAATAIKQ
jgi:hypothetical protein